jgi:hypothetical protein
MKNHFTSLFCLLLMTACSPSGPIVIKYKDHLSVSISGGGPDDFIPDADLVAEIEKKLPEQITQLMSEDTFESKEDKAWIIYELGNYDRRYRGITNDPLGRKLVVIDLYHKTMMVKEEDLKSLNWAVDGGGVNIWSVTYDVEKGKFRGFYMNAPI